MDWFGTSVTGPSTWVWFVGWSLTTITFVKVMLPALLTTPEKASKPPGGTGLAGQFFVTTKRGRGRIGQSADWIAFTFVPLQMLLPLAVTVSRMFVSQMSVGTRYEPAKLAF